MWRPSLYLKFGNQRTQPCLDLAHRIAATDLSQIVDLGCGPGNSTAVLKAQWPEGRITGVDNSPLMLEQARRNDTEVEWVEADVATWRPRERVDLIFSNAALQWVPDHQTLLPSLLGHLRTPGVLAVQIPYHLHSPAHRIIEALCKESPWRTWLSPAPQPFEILEPDEYYRLLAPLGRKVELWQTTYLHVLERPSAVVEWMQGTGLRPYLEGLPSTERDGFLTAYGQRGEQAFPAQPDGRVLFPFPRLFLLVEL